MTAIAALSLSERLRSRVATFTAGADIDHAFEPGGQLHGVGIPSALYCRVCGHDRLWHDVAEAAAIVAAHEAAIKECV